MTFRWERGACLIARCASVMASSNVRCLRWCLEQYPKNIFPHKILVNSVFPVKSPRRAESRDKKTRVSCQSSSLADTKTFYHFYMIPRDFLLFEAMSSCFFHRKLQHFPTYRAFLNIFETHSETYRRSQSFYKSSKKTPCRFIV